MYFVCLFILYVLQLKFLLKVFTFYFSVASREIWGTIHSFLTIDLADTNRNTYCCLEKSQKNEAKMHHSFLRCRFGREINKTKLAATLPARRRRCWSTTNISINPSLLPTSLSFLRQQECSWVGFSFPFLQRGANIPIFDVVVQNASVLIWFRNTSRTNL